MKRWDVIEVGHAIIAIPECAVVFATPAEDYVTQQLTVAVAGSEYSIYVRGFRTDHKLLAENNEEIEMVEVTSGYSDGDLPNDPEYVIVHAKVKAAIMKLGYSVVNSLEPYF